MQRIRRIEVNALRKCGYGDYVKKTFTSHPTYYVVEEENVLDFLEMFRSLIKQK